ncbi:hypothetical protein Salat_0824800 [Sesamum alatum]|uniref:BED-type domain-containing protein n=1 Tax=Sesamum alatum TaxID=300844 RepID=A0AAE2CVX9_9LAMI|nr:hypothetical protein Salat_0824800 [Sesamum alatum]
MASNMEPVAVTSQKHDPAWKHCQMFKNGDRVQLKCIYCGKIFKGGGIHRIKEHLAGQKGNAATCLRVQPDVRLQMLESLNGVAVKKRKKQKLAQEMSGYDNTNTGGVEVVNNHCGLNTEIVLLPVPEMIEHDGDVYANREDGTSSKTSGRKKKGRVRKAPDLVNSNTAALASFPAMNSKKVSNTVHMAVGRFFFDVGLPVDAVNSAYFQPMIDAIASQGTGVVGPSYHDLRSWILKNLVHEDLGELPTVKMILDQAKSISRYIYSNSVVLNMMRRYTFGVDLVDLGTTRSSTDFMTLKRMVNIRHNLQSMITSEEWMESPYSKKSEGFAVLDTISSQSFWSTCALVTRLTDPLLRLLRIVSSEKRPAMGFVYVGLYRAKEAIKKELVNKEEYLVYWNIIDRRWEQLQRHPLHAAGFYLNPKFFYSLEGDTHLHVRSLVYDCIEKLVPDPKIQDKIMKETASYHGGVGDFGRKMAIRARDTLLPTEWWLTYGGGCPNLARLAIRILSQTCCLIHHKLDKIPLEHMHERKNSLEHQRLNDLVFVQYNMSMKHMVSSNKQQEAVDPISYEHIDIVDDWVMETELCSDGSGNTEWMAVDPPLGNVMLLGPQIDDIEALGAGFDDHEIFVGVKDSEEENGEENIGNH